MGTTLATLHFCEYLNLRDVEAQANGYAARAASAILRVSYACESKAMCTHAFSTAKSAAGRAIFVLWALVAVPVVAAFAVQAVTTVVSQLRDSVLKIKLKH